MPSIFDELADEYGLQIGGQPRPRIDDTQRLPPVTPRPRPPQPPPRQPAPQWGWTPPPPPPRPQPRPRAAAPHHHPAGLGCPVCAERDRPWVLVHRHLDQLAAQLGWHLTELEQLMSAALDNANEQYGNLTQTITGTVIPALQTLGQLVAQSSQASGVPDDAVQQLADGISTITSQLAAATQAAMAQIPAQPQQ